MRPGRDFGQTMPGMGFIGITKLAMLGIDKLSIPLPYLALYGGDDGSLWTDPITLQHENLTSLTRFQLNQQLPQGITSRHQLAAPASTPDKHGLIRAFTGIFNQ